jgi:hypothetical protein
MTDIWFQYRGGTMHARLTLVEGTPEQLDAGVEMARSDVLPALQGCAGYKGFTLGVDRSSGKIFGVSFFDSEDSLRASEETIRAKRDATASAAGGSAEFAVYEVLIDDEA